MKSRILAYIAGIIDGEGSIRVERTPRKGHIYYRLRVSVANTSIELMQWLEKNVGGSFVKERKRHGNQKQQYQWDVNQAKLVSSLLHLLSPYLVIKTKQTEIAFQVATILIHRKSKFYSSEERATLQRLHEQMAIVNKKGLTEPT